MTAPVDLTPPRWPMLEFGLDLAGAAEAVPADVLWNAWRQVYPPVGDDRVRAHQAWLVDRLAAVHGAAFTGDPVALVALGCWWRTIWTETGPNLPVRAWLAQHLGADVRFWLMRRDRADFLPGVVRATVLAEDLAPGRWRPAASQQDRMALGEVSRPCIALPLLAPAAPGGVSDVLALDPGDERLWWSLTGGHDAVCGFAPQPGEVWTLHAGPLGWLRAGMPLGAGAILDMDEAIWRFGEWAAVRATALDVGAGYFDRRQKLLRPKRPALPSVFADVDEAVAA